MTYLITGATGDVGSKVVDQLLQRGDRPRVFVRDAEKARPRFGERVDIFVGDLEDAETLKAALEGVDELFLVNTGPRIPARDEAVAKAAKAAGARLQYSTSVAGVETGDGRVRAVRTSGPAGAERIEVKQALSTIPISQLARLIQPAAPESVLAAACALKFRAMILIYLVLGTEQFTEYDAHYFPEIAIPISAVDATAASSDDS